MLIINITRNHHLLPCPCCGGEPMLHDTVGAFESHLFVECPECGLRTAAAAYYTEDSLPTLVKAWPDLDRAHVFDRLAASWNIRVPLAAASRSRSPSRPVCSVS